VPLSASDHIESIPALVRCVIMLHTAESAAQPERAIAEGDLVVVYEGFESMKAVRVAARAQFQNKFGCFDHKVIMPPLGGSLAGPAGWGPP
jgi:tRNA (adenine57-N1/adenine58-N1)-methyltransferase